jgi:hypothetical protein
MHRSKLGKQKAPMVQNARGERIGNSKALLDLAQN